MPIAPTDDATTDTRAQIQTQTKATDGASDYKDSGGFPGARVVSQGNLAESGQSFADHNKNDVLRCKTKDRL